MSAPKPNAELAYRVLDQIDAHPEQWQQDRWWDTGVTDCGTAGCFAGWACQLSGETPRHENYAVVAGTGGVHVPDRAAQLLGFADWDAMDFYLHHHLGGDAEMWLFRSENTRADLGRLVAEIFGPRPATVPCCFPRTGEAHDPSCGAES